jgi:hypothetical protein
MELNEIIDRLNAETDRVWLTEPDEVKRLRAGYSPLGSGAGGQNFSNMVFVNGDMRALSTWITPGVMLRALQDETYTLKQCQDLFAWINMVNVDFLAYAGFTTFAGLTHEIVRYFPTMKTKEDFQRVLEAWYPYANRMYYWVHQMFPWGLGVAFPIRQDEGEELGFPEARAEAEAYFAKYGELLVRLNEGYDAASEHGKLDA